jgi:hypothetical protein
MEPQITKVDAASDRRQTATTTMGRFAPAGKAAAKSPARHRGEAVLKSVVKVRTLSRYSSSNCFDEV